MDLVNAFTLLSQVPSAVLNAIQARAAGLFQLTGGWKGRRPTLACDGTNVTVGAHNGAFAGTTFSNAVLLPGATSTNLTLPALSANTWYYVYAYNGGSYSAPSLAYEIVSGGTAVPDATRCFRGTDASRVYVGCFRTKAAAALMPFRMANGVYTWDFDVGDHVTDTVLGTSAAFAPIDLFGRAPPHARIVHLLVQVNAAAGSDAALVRGVGSAAAGLLCYPGSQPVRLECSSSQGVEYKKNTATNASFYSLGFEE